MTVLLILAENTGKTEIKLFPLCAVSLKDFVSYCRIAISIVTERE